MKAACRIACLLVLLALVAGFGVAHAASCYPPVYALSCDGNVYGGGQTVDLGYSSFTPTGITLATVPSYQADGYAFVSQGNEVKLFKYTSASTMATIDLATPVGLPFLMLTGLTAAGPVTLDNGQTQYALYAVGLVLGSSTTQAYYFVLDQEALLDANHPGPMILDHGMLCYGGSCGIAAAKVGVSGSGAGATNQIARIAVLDPSPQQNELEQSFYRLNRGGTATGPWTVIRDHSEGIDHAGGTWPHVGFDTNRYSGVDYGLYPTSQTEIDLGSGSQSCALGGEPSDLAIWALDPADYSNNFDHTSYHFVTLDDGVLLGFPEGQCPSIGTPTTISEPIGFNPTAEVILQYRHREFLVYAATDAGVEIVEMVIDPWGDGDDIQLLAHEVMNVPCPVDLTFVPSPFCQCGSAASPGGVQYCSLAHCYIDENGNVYCPGSTEDPKHPDCLDENDPTCVTEDDPAPPGEVAPK